MSANPDFDAIASTSFKHFRKKFADNVSNSNAFLRFMKMKGRVMVSGGDTILEELMFDTGPGGSYSGSDTLDITIPEGMTAAEFNWKQYFATVSSNGTEQIRNSGATRIQSLVSARIQQAQFKMSNDLGADIYKDGTGNLGKDLLGLAAIVDTDPTTGVLGGIDRQTQVFWRNFQDPVGSFATNGLDKMGTMVRNLTRGKDRPNLIVAGNTVYGFLEKVATNQARFQNPKMADQGFQALRFEGIDVLFDNQATDDRMYFLNTDFLKFNIHTDRNFTMGKFIEPADQDFKTAKILWAGQLTVSNCFLQGVLHSFTP